MIKNPKKLEYIRRFKKDIIGDFILKRKLTVLKLFLLKIINKRRRSPDFFYRIGIIEKPYYFRKKTKFHKYFIKRQQFRQFYNFIKVKKLKKIVKKCLKKKNSVNWFVYYMESRLDVLLFRLNLVSSMRMSKQFIKHGNVLVNNEIQTNPGYNLKENDYFSFKHNITPIIKKQLYLKLKTNSIILKNWPNYVEYSLKYLIFIFTKINVYDVQFFLKNNFHTFASLINFYRKNLF